MVSVFNFKDPVAFLKAAFEESRRRNPRLSLRAWSRRVGLNEAASLSHIFAGDRKISERVASKLKTALQMSPDEKEYFDLIRLATSCPEGTAREFYKTLALNFRRSPMKLRVRLEMFNIVSKWYHFVILEMTKLSDFREDFDWIYNKLGSRVSLRDIRSAVIRLSELGYLRRNASGRLERGVPYFDTDTDIPHLGLRQLHQEFVELGLDALQTQDVNQRDVTCFNTVTSQAKIPEAKKMIAKFRSELMHFLEVDKGDTVYQVNIQMFNLLD